jgi:hypothetical protein
MPRPLPAAIAASFATTLLAAVLAAGARPAFAAGAAPAVRAPISPDQPKPRVGNYRIVSRGDKLIHAKCLEGGNVVVPTHKAATATQRDRAIHEACKTVDYTK